MKTLLVLAHPRGNSLTRGVADIIAGVLERNGHGIEWADLVEEGFDPGPRGARATLRRNNLPPMPVLAA